MRLVRIAFRSCVLLAISCLVAASCAAAPSHDSPIRALHLPIRNTTIADAKHLVDIANDAGFNTIVVALSDGVAFPRYPGAALKSAWSVSDLQGFADYCTQRGIRLIPEVKLLTHQEKFLGTSRPELMFNGDTYDPRNPEVYVAVYAYLDEIVDALHPDAIHIGHDEVVGRRQRDWHGRMMDSTLPAPLFLEDVRRIHEYLSARNIETWMWGDMLISPKEFPTMLGQHLHGGIDGYGKSLRAQIPKDIFIIDWHYFDDQKEFPSLRIFHDEGFRVLGATWTKESTIENFSDYASKNGSQGMMATIWFHVQRREWHTVESTISISGRIFMEDFPDGR